MEIEIDENLVGQIQLSENETKDLIDELSEINPDDEDFPNLSLLFEKLEEIQESFEEAGEKDNEEEENDEE